MHRHPIPFAKKRTIALLNVHVHTRILLCVHALTEVHAHGETVGG